MWSSLYARLSLVLVAAFVLLGLWLMAVFDQAADELQAESLQRLHASLAAQIVKDIPLWSDRNLDQPAVKQAFHTMMVLGPLIELYVIDSQGQLIAYDAPEEKIRQRQIDLQPVYQFLQYQPGLYPLYGDDPRSDRQKVFTVAPIMDAAEQVKGYLYIVLQGEKFDNVKAELVPDHNLQLIRQSFLTGLMLLLFISLMLFYAITRPLRQLVQRIRNFQQPAILPLMTQQPAANEVQAIQQAFDQLEQHIDQQFEALAAVDQNRREMFRYISHDLKTPLTALQASLETVKHAVTSQSEDSSAITTQHQRFIDIAWQQCLVLGERISEISELNQLEAQQIKPQYAAVKVVTLAAWLTDYETPAQQQGIQLTVNCIDVDATDVINVDKRLFERALANIVDNAIRYTLSEGSVCITLHSQPEGWLKISIADNGIGIEQDDLEHLFKPYFRADNVSHTTGSGLGLAIAHQLLALHDIQLAVDSEPGQGTYFWFRCRLADHQ